MWDLVNLLDTFNVADDKTRMQYIENNKTLYIESH